MSDHSPGPFDTTDAADTTSDPGQGSDQNAAVAESDSNPGPARSLSTPTSAEIEIGGRYLTIETGKVAKQASGAVTVRFGDTVVLVAAVGSKEPREGINFFPLTVDYREKLSAAGRFPGGFFKREGRPTEKEVLSCRLIDRSIRPLFSRDLRAEVQVHANVLSADQENDSDILALVGASAALSVSDIPFDGPVSAVRIGLVDGQFVVNPTFEQLEESEIDLVIAGTAESVLMVEGSANEVPEAVVIEALEVAQTEIRRLNAIQIELAEKVGKQKRELEPVSIPDELRQTIVENYRSRIEEANRVIDKMERQNAMDRLHDEAKAELAERFPEMDRLISTVVDELQKQILRGAIIEEQRRTDGRRPDEIRHIECEVGLLPRTHGSALFTRGETQALVVTTLGTSMDEQKIDELEGQRWKSYMLHYNFPSYSVGEVRPFRGPSRREIGHGALAERSIEPVIPSDEVFPYTIRVVSDILESNGSSSMATVCGGSLALMDAGVPLKCPIAGVAMGLVKEGDRHEILTDILGIEDHLGDMDFKVTGSRDGITAFQMDVKIAGISFELFSEALDRARRARLHILDAMQQTIAAPREELSVYAPRITVLTVKPDKVRDIIGPGGRTIRRITDQTGAQVDIEDDGTVKIASYDSAAGTAALEMIKALVEDPEIGRIYRGKVKRVVDFGAFIEILPGRDGLCHISELEAHRVNRVEDVLREGDVTEVKVIGIDPEGKVKLSRKQASATLSRSER
jgi:polyribonucleotide nucleotidyltransferase